MAQRIYKKDWGDLSEKERADVIGSIAKKDSEKMSWRTKKKGYFQEKEKDDKKKIKYGFMVNELTGEVDDLQVKGVDKPSHETVGFSYAKWFDTPEKRDKVKKYTEEQIKNIQEGRRTKHMMKKDENKTIWHEKLGRITKEELDEFNKKNPGSRFRWWQHDDKNMMKKDFIRGGLADTKSPKDFDFKALKAGIKVEMEHTRNPKIAREIAQDHLVENPAYYKYLDEMEHKMETAKAKKRRRYMQGEEPMKSHFSMSPSVNPVDENDIGDSPIDLTYSDRVLIRSGKKPDLY
jgi:hypothetical protein